MQQDRGSRKRRLSAAASWWLVAALAGMLYLIATRGALADDSPSSPARASSEESSSARPRGGAMDGFSVNYFGIFHGPAIGDIGPYQPKPTGGADTTSPIFTQNYLNLNKSIGGEVAVTAQAYWLWQPVLGAYTEILDPSLRVSNGAMIATRDFSLYSDLRAHLPVSQRSRQQNMQLGLQTFHVAQYNVPTTDFALGLLASFRYNWFGEEGFGRQIEAYAAPSVSWQLSPKLAVYTSYEVTGVNFVGDPGNLWYSDGTDLEPGLRWDVNDRLMISPYLHLMVTDRVGWDSTQFGMMVNWTML